MASVYDIKPGFQNLLRPLTRALAAAGVTANQVTVVAALLSAAVGACVWFYPTARWPLLVLPAFLFVRMALNAIDGMLAREHNMKSRLGAVLNEVGDVLADTALYLPLAVVPGFTPWLVVVITILAIVSEMTGVVAVQIGATRRYDGPMGKSDRAFAFGLLALLLGLGVSAGPWLHYVQVLIGALLVLTIVRRARRALAEAPAAK
jgi:CDP-diacylglycerol--glycerol-3-phosphate 3-phosphatidyltransferase